MKNGIEERWRLLHIKPAHRIKISRRRRRNHRHPRWRGYGNQLLNGTWGTSGRSLILSAMTGAPPPPPDALTQPPSPTLTSLRSNQIYYMLVIYIYIYWLKLSKVIHTAQELAYIVNELGWVTYQSSKMAPTWKVMYKFLVLLLWSRC